MRKVELHVHLDGSVRVSTVSEILNIDYDTCYKAMTGKNLKSLDEYLTRFDYPIKVMQTYENIKRVAFELALDLINDECVYAEVRFAPMLHTTNLSLVDVCKAVLDGFTMVKRKIKINLILCMMRNMSASDNKKIIDLYNMHIDDRIVGLDLAGSELLYSNELFFDLFETIKKDKIPFTIHSGEINMPNNIKIALENDFKRIGHGISVVKEKELMEIAKKKDVLFEVAPTSNVDTFNCKDYKKHPIKKMFDEGLNISINTDDRTVSNITLNEEYENLRNTFGFTDEDFKEINICAMKHSFADKETKKKIIDLLK